jgi:hypothetical protein
LFDSLVKVSSDDLKLVPLNGPSVTNVHGTNLIPLILAKISGLRGLTIWAQHFENTTAGMPLLLCIIMTLLGDASIGPEPESMMYLCSVSRLDYNTTKGLTAVALRASAARGKSLKET